NRTGLSLPLPTSCIPWKGTPKLTKTARPFAVPNPLRSIGMLVGDGLRTVQTPTSTLQPLISNRHTSKLKPIASHSKQTSANRSNRHNSDRSCVATPLISTSHRAGVTDKTKSKKPARCRRYSGEGEKLAQHAAPDLLNYDFAAVRA